jgi:hypothetical protein
MLPSLNERLILNKNSGAASKDESDKSMKAVELAGLLKGLFLQNRDYSAPG